MNIHLKVHNVLQKSIICLYDFLFDLLQSFARYQLHFDFRTANTWTQSELGNISPHGTGNSIRQRSGHVNTDVRMDRTCAKDNSSSGKYFDLKYEKDKRIHFYLKYKKENSSSGYTGIMTCEPKYLHHHILVFSVGGQGFILLTIEMGIGLGINYFKLFFLCR